ncbi:MAG TPA: hypothetical protein VE076_00710 [Nitrososphaeraceae archaeon]|nr:hypothetical protein [Nitrososphaeraceae archaeon]
MNADKSRNKDKEKDASLSSQESKEGAEQEEREGDLKSSTHTVQRNVMDTADVARASIAKGIRGKEDVSAADIVKGRLSSDKVISYSTGIRPEDGKVIDPDKEVSITKHLNKDIITNTEDASKVATRGTSSTEDGGIDQAGIYSDDGTRHIDRAQETPTEEVEDKQTGSWKIKEKDEKRREK